MNRHCRANKNRSNPNQKRILLYAILFLFAVSSVFADSSEHGVDTRDKVYACGYNSLYLFLRLKGYDVSFETVKSNTIIGQNGTSFFDLQTGAAACNVKTQTVQCSYETLQKLPLPLIAWIDKSETQSSEKVIGHFVVLISCTPENVNIYFLHLKIPFSQS